MIAGIIHRLPVVIGPGGPLIQTATEQPPPEKAAVGVVVPDHRVRHGIVVIAPKILALPHLAVVPALIVELPAQRLDFAILGINRMADTATIGVTLLRLLPFLKSYLALRHPLAAGCAGIERAGSRLRAAARRSGTLAC